MPLKVNEQAYLYGKFSAVVTEQVKLKHCSIPIPFGSSIPHALHTCVKNILLSHL